MKKLSLALLASTALFGGFAQSASAADMPVYKAPPPVYVYSWTGCYVGAHGGYGRAQTGHTLGLDDFGNASNTPRVNPEFTFTNNFTPSGGVVGLQGGCNYQTGKFVVGIEGDYSWSNATHDFAWVNPDGDGDSANVSTKMQSLGSVRGRVGIAEDRALLYLTAGIAWARFNYSFALADPNDADGTSVNSLSYNTNGIVFGGGAEYAATDWLILRAEYLHYALGNDFALPVGRGGVGPIPTDHVTFKTIDVIRVGASFKFGGSSVVAKY